VIEKLFVYKRLERRSVFQLQYNFCGKFSGNIRKTTFIQGVNTNSIEPSHGKEELSSSVTDYLNRY